MDFEEAKKIHSQEEQARERGDFVGALKLAAEAKVGYQEAGHVDKLAEVVAAEFLIYKHLADKTNAPEYRLLAKMAATTAVELAKLTAIDSAMAIPTFNLAKSLEENGEIEKAAKVYREALGWLTKSPPDSHNRQAVRDDFEIHASLAEYKTGDVSAKERVLGAIAQLENNKEELPFTRDVWSSGGYMKLAEAVYPLNRGEALDYLKKAKAIIDGNKELILREEQWRKLVKRLGVQL